MSVHNLIDKSIDTPTTTSVVLITGISGSGKSVALHALEDAGFYCVDNLPPEMVPELLQRVNKDGRERVAIAVDVRSLASPSGIANITSIEKLADDAQVLFLDASTQSLVQRFSETRRRHPLSTEDGQRGLIQSIELERELLEPLKDRADCIDTSHTSPSQLRAWIKQTVRARKTSVMLIFESFGFKRGLPLESDFVFDARMLPNPYYDPKLRPLSGRDEAVIAFFAQHPRMADYVKDIGDLLQRWLPHFAADHRSYVSMAVGCTGGQHRSVYIAEQLAERFKPMYDVVLRHRDVKDAAGGGFENSEPSFDLSLGWSESQKQLISQPMPALSTSSSTSSSKPDDTISP
jgi:RNase adapter protein RapZ